MLPWLLTLPLALAQPAEPWALLPDPAGHIGRVRALALSASGQLTASLGDDGTLRIWVMSSEEALMLPALTQAEAEAGYQAVDLQLSQDGSRLALVLVAPRGSGLGSVVKVMDPVTAEQLWQFTAPQPPRLAFSPDATRLAVVQDTELSLRSAEGLLRQLPVEGTAHVAAWTPDGTAVVLSVEPAPARDGSPRACRLLRVGLGRKGTVTEPWAVHDLRTWDPETDQPNGRGAWCSEATEHLSIDGDTVLMVGRTTARLTVLGAPSAALLVLEGAAQGSPQVEAGLDAKGADLSLSRGRMAGFRAHGGTFWTLDLGTGLRRQGGPEHRLPHPAGGTIDLDADLAVVADASGGLLWFRPSDRSPLAMAAGLSAPATAVVGSDPYFIIGDDEGGLTWLRSDDLTRWRAIDTGDAPVRDLAVYKGFVAVAGNRLEVRDIADGRASWSTPRLDATAVGWVADLLVSAHEDGSVRTWKGGQRPEKTYALHEGPIAHLALDPERDRLLTVDTAGGIALARISDGRLLRRLDAGVPVTSLRFSADGTKVLALTAVDRLGGHQLLAWDSASGSPLESTRLGQALLAHQGHLYTPGEGVLRSIDGGPTLSLPGLAWQVGPSASTGDRILLTIDDGLSFGVFAPGS